MYTRKSGGNILGGWGVSLYHTSGGLIEDRWQAEKDGDDASEGGLNTLN